MTRERDQAVKQAKSEASRKERDMLASHTSEVGGACISELTGRLLKAGGVDQCELPSGGLQAGMP